MIAVECPQCGAPTPAFPLTPDRVACRACKYVGPPKPEVLEQLRSAAAKLGSASAHEARHIGAMHANGVASLLLARARLHRWLYVLVVPFGLLGSCTIVVTIIDDPNYTLALMCALPLALLAVAMIGGSRYLDAQTRKLAAAVGAVPPATPGEPAQCHLCGGELPAATNASPIVSCRHCGADNVASPALLDGIVRKRHVAVTTFSRDLVSEASNIAIRSASAVTFVFAVGIAAPFIGCIGAAALHSLLDDVELERIPAEYVYTRINGRLCFAFVREKASDGTWSLQATAPGKGIVSAPGAARFTRRDARWFLKQRVRTSFGDRSPVGTIIDVRPHVLRPRRNQATIRMDGTKEIKAQTIEGLCVVDEPPNVVAFEWPAASSAPSASSARDDGGAASAAPSSAATDAAALPPSPESPESPKSSLPTSPGGGDRPKSMGVPKSPR